MIIRKFKKKDRNRIREILKLTKHFSASEIRCAMECIDDAITYPWQKDYTIKVICEVNQITPSQVDENVVGFMIYGKRAMTEYTWDLYWIAVDPTSHGQGYGKELVHSMEEDIRNRNGKIILIETSGQLEYSHERNWYEKMGYSLQTVIKDFYKQDDNLYQFIKYFTA